MKRKGYSMFGRTIAFILLVLSLVCIPVGIIGTYAMVNQGFYIANARSLKDKYLDEYFYELGKELLYSYNAYGEKNTTKKLEETCIYYQITLPDGSVTGNYTSELDLPVEWYRLYSYERHEVSVFRFEEIEQCSIEFFVPVHKSHPDYVALVCFVSNNAQLFTVLLPVLAIGGFLVAVSSFVYLMCAAGWNRRENRQTGGVFEKIPTDVFLILAVCASVWLMDIFPWKVSNYEQLAINCGGLSCLILFWMIILVSICARVKAGTVFSYSVIGMLWKWVVKFFYMLKEVVYKLPMLWKSALIAILISAMELVVLCLLRREIAANNYEIRLMSWIFALWVLEKLVLLPIILYQMLKLRELQEAAYRLAEGDINYKVDTTLMSGEIRKHGQYLNRISEGVGKAVNERMKSEHLKTELITNVSHDIKTPLTSIINYADLINKTENDNEKLKEYSDVLYRQSARLKKLIEDLVEASKASTGNIEVNLQTCDVGVLLEQAAGEFAQRLYEKDIDLVSKQPEGPVQIEADPKLLWRVFDNLMNNICKYSQSGTRVYLSVEEQADRAVISFKNISEFPLNISAEELMERFVRGDRSRHTEGNGLGLNIARSLTELQKGTLELVIDGDLFKVLLSFPIHCGEEPEPQRVLPSLE